MLRHSWIPAVACCVFGSVVRHRPGVGTFTHTHSHTQSQIRETPPTHLFSPLSSLRSRHCILFFPNQGQCHFPFVHVNHGQYSKPPPPYLRQNILFTAFLCKNKIGLPVSWDSCSAGGQIGRPRAKVKDDLGDSNFQNYKQIPKQPDFKYYLFRIGLYATFRIIYCWKNLRLLCAE